MRPVTLSIEGLRSFRKPVTIDFTGRGHVAVIGDTGAGKSSILEAITYALYGESTFSRQANRELMNDTSEQLRVVLRFRIAHEDWEVARALRRGVRGAVGQVRAQLRRLDASGGTVETVEQVRRVNERVQALIGLDSDAFLRTVVLPQGRFARLLVEDDPRARSLVLRQVWRTDDLEEMGARAAEARRRAAEVRLRVEQEASAHPEDPDVHLVHLNGARDEAQRRADAATETARKAAEARAALRAAERAQRTAAAVAERLSDAALDRATDRLAPIEAIARRMEAEETDLRRRRAEARDALARIPADDGPTSEEAAAAVTLLEGIAARVREAVEAADALRTRVGTAAERSAEAERAAAAAARAAEKATRHGEARARLRQAVESARARRSTVERLDDGCRQRERTLDAARAALDRRRRESAEVRKQLDAAGQEDRAAAKTAAAAEERLASARRTESAAAAADDLRAGDDCPICGRELTAGWTAPSARGLQAARRSAEVARGKAEAARERVVELEERRKGAVEQVRAAEEAVSEAGRAFRAAVGALADEAATDAAAPPPPRETLLRPLDAALKEAEQSLDRHDREHARLEAESKRLDAASARAREAAAGAERLTADAGRTADAALARVREAIRAVPAPFRPGVETPGDPKALRSIDTAPVDERLLDARDRERLLEARENEQDRLREALDEVGEAAAALARKRDAEVDEPLRVIAHAINEHRFVLAGSIGDLGLEIDAPATAAGGDAAALRSRIDDLRAVTAGVSRAAGERAQEAAGQAEAARGAVVAIGRRLDREVDAAAVDAVVEAAADVAEDARFAARGARRAAEEFAAVVDDVRALRGILAEAGDLERALADLDDALKPGAFLKWLTLRRSRSLLVHASRMLGEMSRGKYAFVDPEDAEEQWRILDRESGQARSPASLSGGEQFMASLALALGMVEMMARSGGRLESLFLDEGFGSLDRRNLDGAVEALATVAAGGRMVGVISHVRAVAEQIDHVLSVTRDAAGSRVEWLSADQRRRVSQSDAGLDAAAAAMSGLLE